MTSAGGRLPRGRGGGRYADGLGPLDADVDQVAGEIMAVRQRKQALAGMILGADVALELDAVAAVSGHRHFLQKAQLRLIESCSICPTRGTHSRRHTPVGHVEHLALLSGSVSFAPLVLALQRKGVRASVVATIRSHPPRAEEALRCQPDRFIELDELRDVIRQELAVSNSG